MTECNKCDIRPDLHLALLGALNFYKQYCDEKLLPVDKKLVVARIPKVSALFELKRAVHDQS